MSSYPPRLYDPFVESSTTGSQEETPSCEMQAHMISEGQDVRSDSPCSESDTSTIKPYQSGKFREQEETRKYETPQEPKKPNLTTTQPPTRIPRGVVFQRHGQESVATAQKGGRVISEQSSSLPIPIPVRSPERLNSRSKARGDGFAGGIRVIEKPRGPRPHILAEQKKDSASSSVEEAPNQPKENITSSSSSSGGWSLEEGMPKRPTNVYTGEYRTRPTLRIAASAEKIIMGPDSPGSTYAVTQRSHPGPVQHPDTPKHVFKEGLRSIEDTTGTSGFRHQDKNTTEDIPVTPSSNTPQILLETAPKRDTGGRQFSIPRKPVNSPSLSSLSTPSPECMQSTPPIPNLPMQYEALVKGGIASGPVTPEKTAAPRAEMFGQSTGESEAIIKPQNKRTASLQAVSDFLIHDAPLSVQNRTFDDIVSQSPSHNMTPQSARIPDSRSSRMLDGFRNIFKHRSTMDKDKKGPNEGSGLAFEDPNTSSAKLTTSPEYSKLDSGRTGLKASAKHPKSSEGWNKNLRLPIPSTDRHRRPTISAPIPISPENMPSFARTTMAARTRAVTSPRGQSAISPQGPARRTHTVAATTGSPQRTSRPSKGTEAVMSPMPKQTNPSHVAGLTKPDTTTSQTKAPQIERSASSSLSKTLDGIRSCVEQLCNKARDESTPSKRERNLRMALSLQQQVSDYNSIEKEVAEAEAWVSKKRAEKCLAENILLESYSQIRAQMNEE
ncbi:hypothetical protein BDV32DRAFT_141802 [Aspergillus pseudonomiae]|uniref:Uncharacterized protein n=1 Tax=Aspergillus pseudonomiae TaxID=1506151 RepID=A0A5N7D006_9EURO|nr:uncharacterized protein BDV37DRAFT_290467 [Aspergillus pseudonomiae]KAB8255690.1 hypothetical protein BDV32DRAFT_141802 [Aspergillus pseudonomiae]KAE8399193.1 hypothetical protein BDV37DRAFT_290467 [Aspergillus pseudonomiae]